MARRLLRDCAVAYVDWELYRQMLRVGGRVNLGDGPQRVRPEDEVDGRRGPLHLAGAVVSALVYAVVGSPRTGALS
jgi:hypothetical protein